MRVGSIVKPKLIEAAIELFADYGFEGVTFLDLAKKAKTTTPSIVRLFRSKQRLFEAALQAVIDRSPDAAQFMYVVYEKKKQDWPPEEATAAAVLEWYSSLSPRGARLMYQAWLSKKKKWEEMGCLPLYKVIDALADSIEAGLPEDGTRTLDARVSAKALILALFQLKIAETISYLPEASVGQSNEQEMQHLVRRFLRGFVFAS